MAETAPRKGPVLQGFLQAVQKLKLRGWAFLPGRPDEHLRIEVMVDGGMVAQTIASMKFGDLERAGIGNGDHGFLLNFATELPVDEPGRVAVFAVAADGTRRALSPSAGAKARGAPAGAPPVAREEPPVVKPLVAPLVAPVVASGAVPTAVQAPVEAVPQAAAATGAAAPGPAGTGRRGQPVFVLGSARSGTTAMMQALRHSGRYEGFNEGHLLPLLGKLDQAVGNHYARSKRDAAPGMKTLIAHVPQHAVMEAVLGGVARLVDEMFPTGAWLDKTPGPEMIKVAPLLGRIWPQARFVFMRRRPVDNIESRRRKFPTISFRDHCRLWAESMMAWHAIRDGLAERSLEVDQVRLATEPEAVAAEVAMLLELTPDQSERLLASFVTDRPQRTGQELAPLTDLAHVDWSEEERAIFRETCGPAIRLFGYDADLTGAPRARSMAANRRSPAAC